jgi:hypothetical protein
MRPRLLLLGLAVLLSTGLSAQSRTPERPRPRQDDTRRYDDGPVVRYRYSDDGRDDELDAYRRWSPRIACGQCPGGRCDDREWRALERCGRDALEIERREREWRREARGREARFEQEMAKREQEFRRKELERWRKHQRDMAKRWRELDHRR